MLAKLSYFLYKHEFLVGISGFILSFLFYVTFPGPVTILRSLPGFISWFCVFLLGDWTNRKLGEYSIFPHRKNQFNKFRNLALASLIMNLIMDATGAWLLKLWYYPSFSNPYIYLIIMAPLGYIMFGLILYIFYRLFKRHWDHNIKRGRLTKFQSTTFFITIHTQLFAGIAGLIISLKYYQNFVTENNVIWYLVHLGPSLLVNIWYFVLLWLSAFWILEYACYALKRETLTRDMVRGNFLPFISIILASIICIILVEFFNTPFQAWKFINWPHDNLRFMNIPLVAYLLWPIQYLILLPVVRLLDGKNEENVW